MGASRHSGVPVLSWFILTCECRGITVELDSLKGNCNGEANSSKIGGGLKQSPGECLQWARLTAD